MARATRTVHVYLLSAILIWVATGRSAAQSSPQEKERSFTVIAVSSSYEDQHILARQVEWIRENAGKMGVVLVIHTGDAVQNNTAEEWNRVGESMGALDGVIPSLLAAGNHESFVNDGKHGPDRDTSMLNTYMPVSRYADKRWYGGCMDGGSENMFFLMDMEGLKFLVLSVEFAPRAKVLDWANKVVSEHRDRRTIVVTHSYLLSGDSKLNFKLDPLKYNQENTNRDEMWDRFISQHGNIFLVLSSHYFSVRRETSIGRNGNAVHEVMACYLNDEDKRKGWLRIVEFCPERDKIQFRTYSPVLDKCLTDGQNQFELEYDMN